MTKALAEEVLAQFRISEAKLRSEADGFRDFWHASGGQNARKVNWNLAFKNWIRRNHTTIDGADLAAGTPRDQMRDAASIRLLDAIVSGGR